MIGDFDHTSISRQGVIEGLRILQGYIDAGNIEWAKLYLQDLINELKLDLFIEEFSA